MPTGTPSSAGLAIMKAKPSGNADHTADLRDSISSLVGGGYSNLSDENAKANFTKIASIVGLKNAQNLFIHISQQNQRPGWNMMKPAERLQRFFDVPSSDPTTNQTLQQVKSFGTGTGSGYLNSVNQVNQNQQGNNLAAMVATK